MMQNVLEKRSVTLPVKNAKVRHRVHKSIHRESVQVTVHFDNSLVDLRLIRNALGTTCTVVFHGLGLLACSNS
jgi:hypothetical protein